MPPKPTSAVINDQPSVCEYIESPSGSLVLDPASFLQSPRRERKEAADVRKTLLEFADEYELLQADYQELHMERQRLLRSGSTFSGFMQEWMPVSAANLSLTKAQNLAPAPQQKTYVNSRSQGPASATTPSAFSSPTQEPQVRLVERGSGNGAELSFIHLDLSLVSDSVPQERLANDSKLPISMLPASNTSARSKRNSVEDSYLIGDYEVGRSSASLGTQVLAASDSRRSLDSLKSETDAISRTVTATSSSRLAKPSLMGHISSITSSNFTYSLSKKWVPRLSTLFPSWYDPDKSGASRDRVSGRDRGSLIGTVGTDSTVDAGPKTRCVLGPVSRKRLCWDLLATVCLLCELWTTPFELIFVPGVEVQVLLILSYSVTAFFTIDIILNFSTGYIQGTKSIIMERSKIIKHYLRGWFVVDLIATIPIDLILASFDENFLAAARLGKGSKMLKTVRYLKLIRAVRMVRTMNSAKNYHAHFDTPWFVRIMFTPVVWAMIIGILAHFNGCLAAALEPEWADSESVAEGLMRYFDSFTMAYVKLIGFTASVSRSSMARLWLFECLVASERIALLVVLGKKLVLASLSLEEQARLKMVQEHALGYLRRRNVSFRTQLEVLYSIQETAKVQNMQKHFKELTTNDIPMQLRRTISQELWATKLLSLGLIMHIAHWNDDFVNELALLVKEEIFPTYATVFKQGEAAIAAYCIIEGELSVFSTYSANTIAIPDFTAGMWLGEKALVNPLLRRSASVSTKVMTMVMAISAGSFKDLLDYLGLTYKFQIFCSEQLWRGLCGRCGVLGDHFADTCPKLRGYDIIEPVVLVDKDRLTKRGSAASDTLKKQFSQKSNSGLPFPTKTQSEQWKSARGNQDLKNFLGQLLGSEKQEQLLLILKDMDIESLEDLENTDIEAIQKRSTLSGKELKAVSKESIAEFREQTALAVHQALFKNTAREQYLVFLSHHKQEAGTEAALLRTELMKAISEDSGNPAHNFDVPVFLDSEDLQNLSQIQERVGMSHNLVVLLTNNVFTRPWVLVELVTAQRKGLRMLPVRIDKPAHEFEMPTEAFYTSLVNGTLLSAEDTQLIIDSGADLTEVAKTIRLLFNRIMITYSPHRSETVRQAEVRDLLKQCGLKVTNGRTRKLVHTGTDASVGYSTSESSIMRARSDASLATRGSVDGALEYAMLGGTHSELSEQRDMEMISIISAYSDRAI